MGHSHALPEPRRTPPVAKVNRVVVHCRVRRYLLTKWFTNELHPR
ncbi:hypothetical protein A176_002290 [Myxococcus hansupus]|uniref:Uncharacterized protein n=1 Tax=Pseudomyxococcus hansupus TaxID=1297742 RepID=A0A0H4WUV4_9BACT|nr:hypothetical protein A176_002290 [Myxococcus hansupus]